MVEGRITIGAVPMAFGDVRQSELDLSFVRLGI
jgi:hypothetical protein